MIKKIFRFIKKYKVISLLAIIGFIILLYGLFLILNDSFFRKNIKVGEKVSISSTIISDKDFLDTVKFGSVTNVKNMLTIGANPKAVDENGRNAMAIAANFSNNPQLINILNEFHVDINHKDVNGYSPLMFAIIANSSLDLISTLVNNGADVNSVTNSGSSVLMIALALNGDNLELINYLISKGSKVNYSDSHKVTPLMVALKSSNNPKVIELLLKNGANPKAIDDLGISTLDILRTNSKLSKDPSLMKKIN